MDINQKTQKILNHRLKIGITLNCIFTFFEFVIGFFTGSLSLISDACANFTDVISLIISFFAQKIAERKPNHKKTYGYGRATILAPLLNVLLILLLTIYIFYKAYEKFYYVEELEGGIVMIIGFIGVVINGGVALSFFKYRNDLNIKSALISMLFDALASAGAFLAGIIILFTGYAFIDPLVSIIIGIMLLISAYKLLKEVANILLQGVPKTINLRKVEAEINSFELVKNVTNLHIWAISSNYNILSCEIFIDKKDLDKSLDLKKEIKSKLKKDFNIENLTIELSVLDFKNLKYQPKIINK